MIFLEKKFGGQFFRENIKVIRVKNAESMEEINLILAITFTVLCMTSKTTVMYYGILAILHAIWWGGFRYINASKHYKRVEIYCMLVVINAFLTVGIICNPTIIAAYCVLWPAVVILPLLLYPPVMATAIIGSVLYQDTPYESTVILVLCAGIGLCAGYKHLVHTKELIELKTELHTDKLTGVKNSEYLLDIADEIKWNVPIGFIVFDLDYFKVFNDSMGHDKGDEMLKKIATAATNALQPYNAILVRSNKAGDEFIIFVAGSDNSKIKEIAETVAKAVRSLGEIIPAPKEEKWEFYNKRYGHTAWENEKLLTITCGYIVREAGEEKVQQPREMIRFLLGKADMALMRGKTDGRDAIYKYEEKI